MENNRIITILGILLIIIFIWSLLELSIIDDKTKLIIKERNEKQDVIYEYEELLEKYVTASNELDEYKRVYGELNDQ